MVDGEPPVEPLEVSLHALSSAAPAALEQSVNVILDLAKEFPAKEIRGNLPATSDLIVEDAIDDSVEHQLFMTLLSILDAASDWVDDPAESKVPVVTWRRTLSECLARLRFTRPDAVQLAAAKCLAPLTRVLLREACDIVIARLQAALKTADATREFVPMQLAVRFFSFGVGSPGRSAVTASYLQRCVLSPARCTCP
jgi:hypothetical protein